MLVKALTALITVAAGIGAAFAAVLGPQLDLRAPSGQLGGRGSSPICSSFLRSPPSWCILVYPAVLTVINSFKDNFSRHWVGLANYRSLFGSDAFRGTLFNTLLWILIVPAACVIVGLAVAVLADRLGPRGEKTAKTVIFLPMASQSWSGQRPSGGSSTTPSPRALRRSAS